MKEISFAVALAMCFLTGCEIDVNVAEKDSATYQLRVGTISTYGVTATGAELNRAYSGTYFSTASSTWFQVLQTSSGQSKTDIHRRLVELNFLESQINQMYDAVEYYNSMYYIYLRSDTNYGYVYMAKE